MFPTIQTKLIGVEMTNYQNELLEIIKKEFNEYRSISIAEKQRKHDKKQFINGLMVAARAVGISFDELNDIVESSQVGSSSIVIDDLSIPAYIRELARGQLEKR